MSNQACGVLLVLGMAWTSGCAVVPVDRFTLEVDLPANFRVKSAANYSPAAGERCTLPWRRGKRPERKIFSVPYSPVASRVTQALPLTETVEGCPLVLRSVEFDFYARWGARDTDVGGDIAAIHIQDRLDADGPGRPESGVLELQARCRWFFRTVGPVHAIRKILMCRSVDANGLSSKASAGGAVQRNRLAGQKLRLVLNLSDEELPAFDDNWVAVPNGWRRCQGESFEDMFAYCRGNTTDFKPIKMPDGRICDVYPTCN